MNTRTKRETKVAEQTVHTDRDRSGEAAAQRVYDCECALHAARVTGIDEWIAAAADRLHTAIVAYLDADAVRSV